MTGFNAIQVGLAVFALVTVARRLRFALWQAPLDHGAFSTALRAALEAGQLRLARRLAEACRPALAAQLALAGLDALEAGDDPSRSLEHARAELVATLTRGRGLIIVLGRVANPVALIFVIIEIGIAAHGGEGLLGLQRGLPARIALQRSLLTFSLGLSTSLVCFAAAAILQRAASATRRSLDDVVSALDPATRKPRRSEM